ncbi:MULTISPECIES: dihydroxyacetone kinase subunit DhaK [unclassified Actinobaculum]|uniref:dihydroxyacetone kinase subunit DhaK n=1 Tax=unclassified Actinobaculum TaxID=2609299 RepID=UPI000D526CFF|nr:MULTISPECIES: dihydroxyacetone kinase subunit DhaK [unclassified Actinobaculum]AWE43023.1 dihydroxyacetone kinase [Actinobaculum sp. 313]RTE48590.1 dihydroxyacetone kinase subunit DhaK [Actinobaculum sp. 352]
MKKVINSPETYTDDMLRGIYAVHGEQVQPVGDDLRCYARAAMVPDKVGIITGGGTGHLPLFLGYVGDGMLDGCGVGDVFQSPSSAQLFELSKACNTGKGLLYLYGNYTGDVMNFDMAGEMCEMEGIETRTVLGNDDVNSAPPEEKDRRRGVAGIFFVYKCAGATAARGAGLDEVTAAAEKANDRTRTVGFAMAPCVIPGTGKPNFELGENEMGMGVGIHGEPGVWTGEVKPARELAKESVETILNDRPVAAGGRVAVLVNGLGSTPLDELYILAGEVLAELGEREVTVAKTYVGEYVTSMDMAGASISLIELDDELEDLLLAPAATPFFVQEAK